MNAKESIDIEIFASIEEMKSSQCEEAPVSPEVALQRSLQLMEFFRQLAKNSPHYRPLPDEEDDIEWIELPLETDET